jgi:hypothetical protein
MGKRYDEAKRQGSKDPYFLVFRCEKELIEEEKSTKEKKV